MNNNKYKCIAHGDCKAQSGECIYPKCMSADLLKAEAYYTKLWGSKMSSGEAIDFVQYINDQGIYRDVHGHWYHVPNGFSKLLAKTDEEIYRIFISKYESNRINIYDTPVIFRNFSDETPLEFEPLIVKFENGVIDYAYYVKVRKWVFPRDLSINSKPISWCYRFKRLVDNKF